MDDTIAATEDSSFPMQDFLDLLDEAEAQQSGAGADQHSQQQPQERHRTRCNTWPRLQLEAHRSVPEVIEPPYPGQVGFLQSPASSSTMAASSPSSGLMTSPLPYVDEEDNVEEEEEKEDRAKAETQKQMSLVRTKGSSRRNPWGNMSYADLITQAIQSSPDKRLTLSQIYEWLVKNVPYFHGKGDSISSIGWKNSIRHNLSLHNKFMRVQNEGAGKSSWWMLNPDASAKVNTACTAKQPRRRANTLDNVTRSKKCVAMGKAKRAKDLRRANSNCSVLSDVPDFASLPRNRTLSNASSCGGRLSPSPLHTFRTRTLSNASSSCERATPPDEFGPSSPCWTSSQTSPLVNHVSVGGETSNDSGLTDEDLENLRRIDLSLDPASSQMLLEAAICHEQQQQLQQLVQTTNEMQNNGLCWSEPNPTPVTHKLKILEQRSFAEAEVFGQGPAAAGGEDQGHHAHQLAYLNEQRHQLLQLKRWQRQQEHQQQQQQQGQLPAFNLDTVSESMSESPTSALLSACADNASDLPNVDCDATSHMPCVNPMVVGGFSSDSMESDVANLSGCFTSSTSSQSQMQHHHHQLELF